MGEWNYKKNVIWNQKSKLEIKNKPYEMCNSMQCDTPDEKGLFRTSIHWINLMCKWCYVMRIHWSQFEPRKNGLWTWNEKKTHTHEMLDGQHVIILLFQCICIVWGHIETLYAGDLIDTILLIYSNITILSISKDWRKTKMNTQEKNKKPIR